MTISNQGRFSADGLPVLIGSLPLASHREALEWITSVTPEIPLWPQLPSNPAEQMLPQFAEGIPCIAEDKPGSTENRIIFDISGPDFDEQMLAFFEEYLVAAEDPSFLVKSRFATSGERAAGLYLLGEHLAGTPGLKACKGQVTGPFTLLTGIKDIRGRAGYFDETIRDMVLKGITMKAAWQTRFLADKGDCPVLLFIDEPALAGLGSSAFIGVTTDEISAMINEVAAGIHQAGGLAGIHVCANTDWNMLLASEIDILSFDAHGFFDRIAPLTTEIHTFLDRGGILAWGGIPTSTTDTIMAESVDSLCALWERQMEEIRSDRSPADMLRRTLITPSCGTGSLSPDMARRVLDLTRDVSATLRRKYL